MIPQQAWELWQSADGLNFMDPTKASFSAPQFLRIMHVGLLCVEDSPVDRPTISEAISMIKNECIILPSVKKPAFLNLVNGSNGHCQSTSECHTVNGLSISTLCAR